MKPPEVDIEEAVATAEAEVGAGPKVIKIGNEEYIVCPACNETGQEVRVLKPGCGRRRAVRKVRPCRICHGKVRIPKAFYDRHAAARPGERF